MVFTKKNEEAVSPVIGVILMVAITVILAAVIAAFVFGMAGNIQKTHVVAVTVAKTGTDTISVTNQGGQDQSSLQSMNVTTSPSLVATCTHLVGTDTYTVEDDTCIVDDVAVGSGAIVKTGSGSDYTDKTKVTVIGTFNDGTTQILLDSTI